jgi:hypothetical protein
VIAVVIVIAASEDLPAINVLVIVDAFVVSIAPEPNRVIPELADRTLPSGPAGQQSARAGQGGDPLPLRSHLRWGESTQSEKPSDATRPPAYFVSTGVEPWQVFVRDDARVRRGVVPKRALN